MPDKLPSTIFNERELLKDDPALERAWECFLEQSDVRRALRSRGVTRDSLFPAYMSGWIDGTEHMAQMQAEENRFGSLWSDPLWVMGMAAGGVLGTLLGILVGTLVA